MRRRDIILRRLPLFSQILSIAFEGLRFIETYATCVSFYKTAIEDSSRQAFVVVALYSLEVAHRDARLIGDLSKRNAALLARETQLFTDSSCHCQSASAQAFFRSRSLYLMRSQYGKV